MIVKIQPPNKDFDNTVGYNEKKMKAGDAHLPRKGEEVESGRVLATRNVPEGSTLLDEFEELKERSQRRRSHGKAITNLSFHMSVNPDEEDEKLDDARTVELIDEIMQGMGYGLQPYRIYEHTDIARKHYHVVSCRAGRDGKKIDDSYERLKLRKLLSTLSEKYGFDIYLKDWENIKEKKSQKGKKQEGKTRTRKPEKKETPAKTNKPKTKDGKTYVMGFSRKFDTPITEQMTDCFNDAMRWHFSTVEQFQHLMMKRYNILAEIEAGKEDGQEHMVLYGLNRKGEEVTPPVSESELGLKMLRLVDEKAGQEKMSARKQQRERLEKTAMDVAKDCETYEKFIAAMEKKGIWVIPSWRKDTDEPFGVTYLDRATRCIWKGSETDVDLKWLTGVAQAKGWTIKRDDTEKKISRSAEKPTRRKAVPISSEKETGGSTLGNIHFKRVGNEANKSKGSTRNIANEKGDYLDDTDKNQEKTKYI